jgi:hypothetical protein
MPPGRLWPKRVHGKVLSKRHRVQVSFGEPIKAAGDAGAVIERVQRFFDQDDKGDGAGRLRKRLTLSR